MPVALSNLPGLDCGIVLASDQAKLFGIPVAWLGVVGLMLIGLSQMVPEYGFRAYILQ